MTRGWGVWGVTSLQLWDCPHVGTGDLASHCFFPLHSLPQHHHKVSLGSQTDTLPYNEPPSQICCHHPHCWGNLQRIHGLPDPCPRYTILSHGHTELLWHCISVSGTGANLTLLFFRAIRRKAWGGSQCLPSSSFVPGALHKTSSFCLCRILDWAFFRAQLRFDYLPRACSPWVVGKTLKGRC